MKKQTVSFNQIKGLKMKTGKLGSGSVLEYFTQRTPRCKGAKTGTLRLNFFAALRETKLTHYRKLGNRAAEKSNQLCD
jgi:hypothetical protein